MFLQSNGSNNNDDYVAAADDDDNNSMCWINVAPSNNYPFFTVTPVQTVSSFEFLFYRANNEDCVARNS
jgi:hypothetical protein